MNPIDFFSELSSNLKIAWYLWLVAGLTLLLISIWPRPPRSPVRAETRDPSSPTLIVPPPIIIIDTVWEVERLPGHDSTGNTAIFDVIALSKEYNWIYERSDSVELNGISKDIVPHLLSGGLQQRFRESQGVIAVGAASEEGPEFRETDRAAERARQLTVWLREAVKSPAPIYSLNLGQFTGATLGDPEVTRLQRRVVILSIIRHDPEVDISEALWNALSRSSSFPMKLDEYTRFDLSPEM